MPAGKLIMTHYRQDYLRHGYAFKSSVHDAPLHAADGTRVRRCDTLSAQADIRSAREGHDCASALGWTERRTTEGPAGAGAEAGALPAIRWSSANLAQRQTMLMHTIRQDERDERERSRSGSRTRGRSQTGRSRTNSGNLKDAGPPAVNAWTQASTPSRTGTPVRPSRTTTPARSLHTGTSTPVQLSTTATPVPPTPHGLTSQAMSRAGSGSMAATSTNLSQLPERLAALSKLNTTPAPGNVPTQTILSAVQEVLSPQPLTVRRRDRGARTEPGRARNAPSSARCTRRGTTSQPATRPSRTAGTTRHPSPRPHLHRRCQRARATLRRRRAARDRFVVDLTALDPLLNLS